jgi:hypothetical protein
MDKIRKETKKGYIRYASDGRLRMEHNIIWEENYGAIPTGYYIHHKDFNKKNNTITNLELVTPLEHKRLHSGCKLIEGVWFKPCKNCGEFKEVNKENWYYSRGCINGKLCKKCYIEKSSEIRKILISKGWKRKNYKPKTKVYNLTLNNIPAFDTKIGVSHNTQKPVQLYKWLLQNYAKEGDTILDTHFGSLSIGIACHDLGFDLTACELDKDYYEAGKKRLKQHQSQLTIF